MDKQATISAGTVIVGRVSASGDIDVLGRVEGSIESNATVTIAAGALVKSDIRARDLVVAGAVAGDLRGETSLVLESGARVVGDISAPTIGIRPGALLRGRVETGAGGDAAPSRGRDRSAAKRSSAAAPKARPATTVPAKKGAPAKKAARKAPAPVMPKAGSRGTKTAARKKVAKPPAPVVPALKKRTKKATKRRGR